MPYGAAQTPTAATEYEASTNRYVGGSRLYDLAGNMRSEGGATARYDGEGRLVEAMFPWGTGAVTTSYVYDAEGRRVKKTNPSIGTVVYVYDAFGQLAAEHGAGGTAGCDTCYLFTDHLGTTRAVGDKNGAVVKRRDHMPFGEEVVAPWLNGRGAVYGAATTVKPGFTGWMGNDASEWDVDYAGARYFRRGAGRFVSADGPLVDQHPEMPQSWNLYSYVRNNPLRFIDPTGRTLTASQGWSDMQGDLCGILGAPDCASRISRDQKTGTVSINFDGIDLSQNEGARLLSDLISSGNTYDLSYGSSVETSGRVINVTFIENLDRNSDWRYGKGKTPEDQPRVGVDGQVAFNWPNIAIKPNRLDPQSVPGSGSAPALRWTTVFHELAESYAKVDKGMQYMEKANPSAGAHWNAVDRERAMRGQRQYLRSFQFGSGGGTIWQPTTRLKR